MVLFLLTEGMLWVQVARFGKREDGKYGMHANVVSWINVNMTLVTHNHFIAQLSNMEAKQSSTVSIVEEKLVVSPATDDDSLSSLLKSNTFDLK